jgi:hypothetical protein
LDRSDAIVKIDVIGSQPFETSVNGSGNVSATTHARNSFTLLIRVATELCSQDDLVSPAADRAADKSLVVTLAVDVGSINKVDAEIKYPFNGGQRFFLFNWVINAR